MLSKGNQMETQDDISEQVENALKLHKMFEDQMKSEMRCANNLLRDAFEPFQTMLESCIKNPGYYLFPDIRLMKRRKAYNKNLENREYYIVQIDLMWFLTNEIDTPKPLALNATQERFVGQIMSAFAERIHMDVKYNTFNE